MDRTLVKVITVVLCLVFLTSCVSGDLTPMDPNSPQAKIVVKGQVNLFRNILLSIKRIDNQKFTSRFTDTLEAFVEPGHRNVEISVSDSATESFGSTNLFIHAKAGHMYVIVPVVGSAGVSLIVEDHFRDIAIVTVG